MNVHELYEELLQHSSERLNEPNTIDFCSIMMSTIDKVFPLLPKELQEKTNEKSKVILYLIEIRNYKEILKLVLELRKEMKEFFVNFYSNIPQIEEARKEACFEMLISLARNNHPEFNRLLKEFHNL